MLFILFIDIYLDKNTKKSMGWVGLAYWLACLPLMQVELAWHSGSVMACHAAARGSIPGGNSVFTDLHVLRKGQ